MSSGTRHYLPLFLEDGSGLLTGSEFIDVHDRMKLIYRRTRQDQRGTQYCVYETSSNRDDSFTKRVIALDFGASGELGSVTFNFGKGGHPVRIDDYLRRVNGRPRFRRFTGQDGRQYCWSYRTHEDHEWTCVDASGTVVAFYHLKTPGEPRYAYSSGCTLTVEEQFGDMACELLATCLIMRHIAAYNIA